MLPILRTAVLGLAISVSGGAALAQTPPNGETLFRQRCGSCHTVQAGQNRMGPSLRGVVGRRAGAVAGYAYSPALRDWGQTWTAANLERYLAGTRATVPGTRMNIAAPPPAQRAEIIRYLQSQR
jgi:cytochrome c